MHRVVATLFAGSELIYCKCFIILGAGVIPVLSVLLIFHLLLKSVEFDDANHEQSEREELKHIV